MLEDWDVQRSFFSDRANHYNTNVGISGYAANPLQPELYCSISVKGYVLSALMSRMVAPLVIFMPLFVIVMTRCRSRFRIGL